MSVPSLNQLLGCVSAAAKGNELTRALVSAGLEVFRAPPPGGAEAAELAEARRRCCCAAYRALAAAVCATQTEAKFFNSECHSDTAVGARRRCGAWRMSSVPLVLRWCSY